MIAAEFDATLVDGVGDDVMVVGAWHECTVEKCLNVNGATRAAEFEVPKKQFCVREPCSLAPLVQNIAERLSHGDPLQVLAARTDRRTPRSRLLAREAAGLSPGMHVSDW